MLLARSWLSVRTRDEHVPVARKIGAKARQSNVSWKARLDRRVTGVGENQRQSLVEVFDGKVACG